MNFVSSPSLSLCARGTTSTHAKQLLLYYNIIVPIIYIILTIILYGDIFLIIDSIIIIVHVLAWQAVTWHVDVCTFEFQVYMKYRLAIVYVWHSSHYALYLKYHCSMINFIYTGLTYMYLTTWISFLFNIVSKSKQ